MKKSLFIVSLLLALSAQAADSKPGSNPAVKKSSTGLCHTNQSRHYAKLQNFTPYDSLKACLDSGGHQSKKKTKA